MEVCIPFTGNPGEVFVVFQRGTGYFPAPSGPRCPLICRDPGDILPVKEIDDALNLLEVSHEVFWNIQDHSDQPEKQESSAHIPTKDTPAKSKDAK